MNEIKNVVEILERVCALRVDNYATVEDFNEAVNKIVDVRE